MYVFKEKKNGYENFATIEYPQDNCAQFKNRQPRSTPTENLFLQERKTEQTQLVDPSSSDTHIRQSKPR